MAEDAPASRRMKRKLYERELRKLQVQLCHLQQWVKAKKLRAIILFEGRDTAGKGGTIKAITERVSPRVFRVVALPAPSDLMMFKATDSKHAPWRVIRLDDKRRARLTSISHVLKAIPYKRQSPEAVKLPKRSMKGHYAATLRRVRFAQE